MLSSIPRKKIEFQTNGLTMQEKLSSIDITERINDESYPFISVIIPVYNDPDGIEDTLNSLVNQDYSAERFEIIIADNGSNDSTIDVIKEYARNYPKLIKFVVEDKIRGSYAARNKGVKASRGEVIAFIDADMSVDANWLTEIAKSLKERQWYYMACRVEIYYKNKSIYSKYNKMKGFPIERYVHESNYAPTCCLVVRKSVFDELGLFDSRLISSGDYEFGNRVHKSGYKLYYFNDIVIRHPARSTFRKLYNKYFRIGRGNLQVSMYYPDRYSELCRVYWRPLNYLPYSPWDFFGEMNKNKIWTGLSFGDKIKIYFIDWFFIKLVRSWGYFYESYKKKNY